MRRSSVIGPLILIAIGVIFLLRNFLPEFRLVEIIGLYWPWLLIGWGMLRVIEILMWHHQGQLTPRGGMNGGEWTLVVIICLIGTGIMPPATPISSVPEINIPTGTSSAKASTSVSGSQTAVGKAPRCAGKYSRRRPDHRGR